MRLDSIGDVHRLRGSVSGLALLALWCVIVVLAVPLALIIWWATTALEITVVLSKEVEIAQDERRPQA